MDFYDMHVHSAFAMGESSLEELAERAKELGFKGFCFVSYLVDKKQIGIIEAEVKRIREKVGIEIYSGFEARSIKELNLLVKLRRMYDILLVRGGNLRLNRIACETPQVDILTHPELGRKDSGLDHVTMKLAVKNKVAIEINLREVTMVSKASRAKVIANITQNIKLAKKYGARIVTCSGVTSHWELKDPLCLASFATLFGLEIKEAKETVSKVPKEMISLAKERRDKRWIIPGVKIVG